MSALDRAAVERFRRDVERLSSGAPGAPLALAVSGGPDSMAMLVLAAAAFPGGVIAATVDHGLRAESAGEARMAGAHAATLDVPHAILTIAAPPSGSGNLQAWARRERYAALRHWAVAAGASALATAHHADDQAETFLMRATRGSGLSGLAGIRARQEQPDMPPLIRPLLDWRRSALREIVAASATPFVDDPGNGDPRFERARLRAALRDVPALDSAGIARSAAHLAGVEADLLAVARWLWRTRMIHGTPHAISIDMTDLPRAVRRIVARDAIAHVMALHGEPWDRAGNIEALLDALEAGKSATQALVMASAAGGVWHFRKAPARGTN